MELNGLHVIRTLDDEMRAERIAEPFVETVETGGGRHAWRSFPRKNEPRGDIEHRSANRIPFQHWRRRTGKSSTRLDHHAVCFPPGPAGGTWIEFLLSFPTSLSDK
jgi:hypothetical protein